MISKEMLIKAAYEVDQAIIDSLPDPSECVHVFSETFERKMKKLIRKANHFVAYKAMRYAASILLAIMVCASMFLAVNTEARAALIGWVKDRFQGAYYYFFPAESQTDASASYILGWVPDTYSLTDSIESPSGCSYFYLNDSGEMLIFTYMHGSDSYSFTAGNGEYEEKAVEDGPFHAEVYIALEEGKSSAITWLNEENDIIFTITGLMDEETLIKAAKYVTSN